MAGHACKWCEWIPEDEDEDFSNQQKFAALTSHQRSEHPDEMRARMGNRKAKKAIKKTAQSEDNPSSTSNSGPELADGDVKVRLSAEQITLPGEMFVLFHWVKTQFPDYEATKGEWLQHVVATWAIDHGEEIRLPSIPGVFINNALNLPGGDDYEDEELEDAEEESDPVATWYTGVTEGRNSIL